MRPNILFLFPDQHRGDWLDLPEHIRQNINHEKLDLKMPNLKKIIDNGLLFFNTITSSPICAPARACLATGTRYFDCGVETNTVNFDPGKKTFYNVLKDNNYSVMSVGKLDVHKATKYWGENGWIEVLGEIGFTKAIDNEGKFDAIIGEIIPEKGNPTGKITSYINLEKEKNRGPYIKYLHDKGVAEYHVADMKRRMENSRDVMMTELDDQDYCDNWITSNAVKMLEEQNPEQPWFLQVNFTGPHDPWDITQKMKELVKDKQFAEPVMGDRKHTGTDIEIKKHYAAMLENIDANIGLILEKIEQRGELGNTIIIYCSDHGEMLGDFGRFGKSLPERASTQIPLIISGELIKNKGCSSSLVELQDLAATILDLTKSRSDNFSQSKSLINILDGTENIHRDVQISALGNWKMISDGKNKYVVRGDKKELYSVTNDKDELNNIIDNNTAVAEVLEKRLMQELSI